MQRNLLRETRVIFARRTFLRQDYIKSQGLERMKYYTLTNYFCDFLKSTDSYLLNTSENAEIQDITSFVNFFLEKLCRR